MAPMAKIREVQEVFSQDVASSVAMREIVALLSSSTPGSLIQVRQHIAQLSPDEDSQALQSLEDTLSERLWEQTWDPTQTDPRLVEELLLCLETLLSRTAKTPTSSTLLRILALTDPADTWSTAPSSRTSQTILAHVLQEINGEHGDQEKQATNPWTTEGFIVDTVLQSYLRPLFSKASSKVTPSGRPAAYQDPAARPDTRLNQEAPPWKKEGPRAVTIFRWAVTHADENLIKVNWPLFTPVLLTLVEAEEFSTRLAGLNLLTPLINKCPPGILHTTGLATVFEDAVFPSLLHLPSLTPEPDSVRLTTAAYDVLLALTGAYGTSVTPPSLATTTAGRKTEPVSISSPKARNELLDRILRRGVFVAYDHASQYVGVVEVLMRTVASVVNRMAIHAVKHLQKLLPIIAAVMTDPFMISHHATVVQATRALNACIATCWPRFVANEQEQGRLIRVVSICWINMHDSDSSTWTSPRDLHQNESLADELKRIAQMINALRETSAMQPLSNMAEIMTREPLLSTLFQA